MLRERFLSTERGVLDGRRALLVLLASALALARPPVLPAQEASLELIADPRELEAGPCSTVAISVVLESRPTPELTGLGVEVLWDSSQIGLSAEDILPPSGVPDAVTEVFLPPGVESPLTSFQIVADDGNEDADPATDSALKAVWLFGLDVGPQGAELAAPRRLPEPRQRLFTLELETTPDFSGTTVHLLITESPPGFSPSSGKAVVSASGEPCRR